MWDSSIRSSKMIGRDHGEKAFGSQILRILIHKASHIIKNVHNEKKLKSEDMKIQKIAKPLNTSIGSSFDVKT